MWLFMLIDVLGIFSEMLCNVITVLTSAKRVQGKGDYFGVLYIVHDSY